MNIPYSWLKELLPEAPAPETLPDIFAGLGLGVENSYEAPAAPKDVIVAKVESVVPIETSDHLKHVIATDGQQSYSVVCGAPNVKVGMLSALAKPGAFLPGAGFTVAKREMQGVASEGVLCSPKELGLYDFGGGLIEFADDVILGTELASIWGGDTILELEITPNRGDVLSMLGVARDLSAKLGIKLLHPAANTKVSDPNLDDGLSVRVEDTQGCPRFTLQRIDNITVKPSPVWLQRRLASMGLRPRNNIVDVTNYITFELGHPSHAFDLDKLYNGTLIVRHAKEGEKLVALNEQEVILTEQDLIISSPTPLLGGAGGGGETKPIGLAGVIGGIEDSISAATSSVALEAAHWNSVMVRKTARRHGIATDAHYRYERGVDPNLSALAVARGAELIAQVGGGKVHSGYTDVGGSQPLQQVAFRPSRVHFLMDFEIPLKLQKTYLERLGCSVTIHSLDSWQVTVPSWRFDLAIEEDLVEEVSRLHGYEHVGESIPQMQFIPEGQDVTHRNLRSILVGMGLQEVMTYVFTSDLELAKSKAPLSEVKLVAPQGADRSVLRTALYPGLLQAAANNHHVPALALFEIGHIFNQQETEVLSLLVRGPLSRGIWQTDQATSFYTFKGLLEKLANIMGIKLELKPIEASYLHPGMSAAVLWNAQEIGLMGKLHPEVAAAYELDEVYIAELTMPLLGASIRFTDYVRQPYAERDIAVIVPKDVNYASLEALVKTAAGERLERLWPFDVYEGQPIPEDKKSLALRFWFRDPQRTLRDEEIEGFMGNIITVLTQRGYSIRDKGSP